MQKKRLHIDWSDIQYVVATAKLGSFNAAALALKTNPSTVGRRVARLEAYLGTKMFDRHGTGMRLTPDGAMLYERAVRMEEAANEIESNLVSLDSAVSGPVRFFAPEGVSYLWLTGVLAEFCRAHPAVKIDLVTHREWPDLFSLDSDLALFIERPQNPRLVASKIAKLEHTLFISKSYEKQFGQLRQIEDVGKHRFVDYVPYHICVDLGWWTKGILSAQRVQLSADSAAVYLAAIRSGVGVGLLPNFYKHAAPDLIAQPLRTNCSLSLWLVNRPIANSSHRTRMLLNYLHDRFRKDLKRWFEV